MYSCVNPAFIRRFLTGCCNWQVCTFFLLLRSNPIHHPVSGWIMNDVIHVKLHKCTGYWTGFRLKNHRWNIITSLLHRVLCIIHMLVGMNVWECNGILKPYVARKDRKWKGSHSHQHTNTREKEKKRFEQKPLFHLCKWYFDRRTKKNTRLNGPCTGWMVWLEYESK